MRSAIRLGLRGMIVLGVLGLASWRAGAVLGQADEAASPEFYATQVKPIFSDHCDRCHMGEARKGGLNLNTRAAVLKGGRHGPAVVPGDPANSLLVKLIRHDGPAADPMPMPPKDAKLSDADISTVERWVKAGAVMPPDPPAPAAPQSN